MAKLDLNEKCPLCESNNVSFFGTHDLVDQNLFHCTNCSYYFTFPHECYISEDTQPDTVKNRQLLAPESFEEYTKWRKVENNRVLNELSKFDDLGKVLEIGFGEGHLTSMLLKNSKEYYGIEPFKPSFERTRDMLGLDSSKIFRGTAEDSIQNKCLDVHYESFDSIVMVSVYEHLSAPKEVLNLCYTLLKPGGKLFLSTPDSSFFKLFYYGRRMAGIESWSFYHISFFTQKSLDWLFSKNGFSISKCYFSPLITPLSISYFKARTKSSIVAFIMTAVSKLGIDKLIRLGTFNYILTKKY